MNIQATSFNCILKNKAGQLISQTFNREVANDSMDSNELLPGLVRGLQNLKQGEKRSILLYAEEAYGLYDPTKIILYPKNKLARTVKVGEMVEITGKSGLIRKYKSLEFYDDMVRLDGNHPLAGQDFVFEIEANDSNHSTVLKN
jgi:FKBP-type peptidyl-prolyl cis-trans isomerase SlyD